VTLPPRACGFPVRARVSRWSVVRTRGARAARRVFLHNELPRRGMSMPARGACGAFGGRVNWSGTAYARIPVGIGKGEIGGGGGAAGAADGAAMADRQGVMGTCEAGVKQRSTTDPP
jgi:hypothetical protein